MHYVPAALDVRKEREAVASELLAGEGRLRPPPSSAEGRISILSHLCNQQEQRSWVAYG